MDFSQDQDEFVSFISGVNRDCTHAKTNFFALLDHWKNLSTKTFGGLVTIEALPDEKGFQGSILGKPFSIEINPIAEGNSGQLEVIVLVSRIGGGKTESGRFRVNRNGDYVTNDGSDAGSYGDLMSIKMFMAILKSVLTEPVQVQS